VTAGVAMQLLISRFASISRGIGSLVQAGMFLDDYQSFLEYGQAADDRGASLSSKPAERRPFRHLLVDRVSFSYPGMDAVVLNDVSIEIGAGEVVALVGANGSGKTTLVKIICQLYRPDSGRVLWNGVDTREMEPEELRSEITVIFQNFIQYHLSAMENIALGRVDRSPEAAAIELAARQAGAHDFIERLPAGYETRLGRQFYGGHELSVGQWQRLALARAFFRSGSFLVLDEPTASLDPKAEHELFAQIRTLTQERSVLLISHRFSSVRSADRIYVLEDGRITESGTHEQLLSLGGHYAELFTLQANAYLGEHDPRGAAL
jgi:ATP-binding cassette subfamily B protein